MNKKTKIILLVGAILGVVWGVLNLIGLMGLDCVPYNTPEIRSSWFNLSKFFDFSNFLVLLPSWSTVTISCSMRHLNVPYLDLFLVLIFNPLVFGIFYIEILFISILIVVALFKKLFVRLGMVGGSE